MHRRKGILGGFQSRFLLLVGFTKDLRLDSRLGCFFADNSKVFAIKLLRNTATPNSNDFVYSYTEEMFEELI